MSGQPPILHVDTHGSFCPQCQLSNAHVAKPVALDTLPASKRCLSRRCSSGHLHFSASRVFVWSWYPSFAVLRGNHPGNHMGGVPKTRHTNMGVVRNRGPGKLPEALFGCNKPTRQGNIVTQTTSHHGRFERQPIFSRCLNNRTWRLSRKTQIRPPFEVP